MTKVSINWTGKIEEEIRRRAADYGSQDHLIVDYYRIRRRIAYPLPLEDLPIPAFPVSGLPVYPWATWLLWAYEERLECLGYAADWFDDKRAAALAERDLIALAGWSGYRQFEKPDLSLGHAGRVLWLAVTQWKWIDDDTRSAIHAAMERIIADALPLAAAHFGIYREVDDILALDRPGAALHNIPVIGTIGAALAAHELNHSAAAELDGYLKLVTMGLLEWRRRGFAEGVGYDGYVMDFLVHWLGVVDGATRAEIVGHPRFEDLLDESLLLSAPGNPVAVAELGDVEPVHMPFHLSAQAKLQALRPQPQALWLLRNAPVGALRADALAALRELGESDAGQAPSVGFGDAHYALTLRSGWSAEDVAVVASLTTSPMGHLHCDAGSLVIGRNGHWVISDPGYQQYMQRSERTFTLGPTAHNCPVINSQQQSRKPTRRSYEQGAMDSGVARISIDMTSCYPEVDGLKLARRTIWQRGRDWIVVADTVVGAAIDKLGYTWHGHPDAAWWVEDGMARIYFPDATLFISSPGLALSTEQVQRIRGSRGQLSLCVDIESPATTTWWIFSFDSQREAQLSADGAALTIDGAEGETVLRLV